VSVVPFGLTICRLVLAVPFTVAVLEGRSQTALLLLAAAGATDALDGWLARRLGATSRLGAHLDVLADVAVILGGLGACVALGVYPSWLFWLIAAMAAQFFVTTKLGVVVYDPLGKYFGGALWGVLVLTLLAPDQAVWEMLLAATVVLTAMSLASRIRFILLGRP
jgi:CDP-diacylglycerol--glycerol-3-phosphate 3-phosphatidyltransferase/cardiolipin synthase